jgi:cytochrome c peroxidase
MRNHWQNQHWLIIIPLLLVITGVGLAACSLWSRPTWSQEELAQLRSLWIGSLPPLPPDPSNRYGDDPQAASLGHQHFF